MVRGPRPHYNALLKVWDSRNKNQKLQYSEIRERVKQFCPEIANKSEQSFVRYLNTLVKQRKLTKQVDLKRNTFYKLSEEGLKEAIREKFTSMLESMRIDGAVEFDGPFLLPYTIASRTENPKLKTLEVLDVEDALPHPELSYAIYHYLGKGSQKKIERTAKFFSRGLLEDLIAKISTVFVSAFYNKNPNFIETIDELVDWYKDAINQKLVIMVVFDGKSVAEKVDWRVIKQKAKETQKDWEKRIRTEAWTFKQSLEAYMKRLPKEEQRRIIEKSRQSRLEYAIGVAISNVSYKRFKSRDEAIDGVIKNFSSLIGEVDVIPSLLRKEMKQFIEEYLASPTSSFLLQHEKYQYPQSNRVYDIYRFALKSIVEKRKEKARYT